MKPTLLGIIFLLTIGLAMATPSIPNHFSGKVRDGDNPSLSLAGQEISASINGVDLGVIGEVQSDGSYEVLVDPEGRTGTITFFINGVQADQTAEYEKGQFTELDLTINGAAADSTAGETDESSPAAGSSSGGSGGGGSSSGGGGGGSSAGRKIANNNAPTFPSFQPTVSDKSTEDSAPEGTGEREDIDIQDNTVSTGGQSLQLAGGQQSNQAGFTNVITGAIAGLTVSDSTAVTKGAIIGIIIVLGAVGWYANLRVQKKKRK